MKSSQLETWVLEICDRVKRNEPIEDQRVELKAEWTTDFDKTARQLAGHLNAARSENVLWIIGLDEKLGPIGASLENLADWLPQVSKRFEGLAPEILCDLNVPIDGKTIVALLFCGDRVPFVVTNPVGGGHISREVPWREGTAVRSARRSDLLRLLVPIQGMPNVEVLSATLLCFEKMQGSKQRDITESCGW